MYKSDILTWDAQTTTHDPNAVSITSRATDEFSSHKTGQVLKTTFAVSCKSSNIVYFKTCGRCGQQ